MAPALGVLWAALVVISRRRPLPVVRARLSAVGALPVPVPRARLDVLGGVGAAVLRVARRPASPHRAQQAGAAIVLALAAAAVHPFAAPMGAAAGWAALVARQRAAERRRMSEFGAAMPDVVDLLSLAVGAGLTVSLAVEAVARRASGPLAVELRRVCDEVRMGRRLADALEDLPGRTGEGVRPLVATLVASERYGAPLGSSLERLAREVRRDRRRRADEAARRVPVKLLFPLVTCTLPAFALLTVAPLLASAVRSLRL